MAEPLVPHGGMQPDGVASPEPAVLKGFKVRGSLFLVLGSRFLISISYFLFPIP